MGAENKSAIAVEPRYVMLLPLKNKEIYSIKKSKGRALINIPAS